MDADAKPLERIKARSYTREQKDAICPCSETWDAGYGIFRYTRKNVNNNSVGYQCCHKTRNKCRAILKFDRHPVTDTNPIGFYDNSTGRVVGRHTRACIVQYGCNPDDPDIPWDGKLEDMDLFNEDEDVQQQPNVDANAVNDVVQRTNGKRSREDDIEEVDIERHNPLNLSITNNEQQENLVTIQSRIAQSIEAKNKAVSLKETIDSASALRREIREERAQRDVLWAKLVDQVGDEGEALSKYTALRKAKQDRQYENRADNEDCVKQTIDLLLDDIFDTDVVIEKLKMYHVKLTKSISKLV